VRIISHVNATLNVLQAEALLRLCRGGRLYGVEKWIAAGQVPPEAARLYRLVTSKPAARRNQAER
jgi:hypothetical protein